MVDGATGVTGKGVSEMGDNSDGDEGAIFTPLHAGHCVNSGLGQPPPPAIPPVCGTRYIMCSKFIVCILDGKIIVWSRLRTS